ncbi:hypothetical protein HPB50_011782 [Hyalomma asiaticum]|uniref:Uncharacterized protein n=1 Tax=Hyalomma asiaticum TaxID=266040 RepID=A0ACB7S955_HYAAI|nr:hypothetical protein HPB50_011782 [Hyalomma asiaticum]
MSWSRLWQNKRVSSAHPGTSSNAGVQHRAAITTTRRQALAHNPPIIAWRRSLARECRTERNETSRNRCGARDVVQAVRERRVRSPRLSGGVAVLRARPRALQRHHGHRRLRTATPPAFARPSTSNARERGARGFRLFSSTWVGTLSS